MNIWAWVRETKQRLQGGDPQAQRLAQLMDELPSAAVDEAHERVDGMVPEALALARDLDEAWVEVFIRHWSLQSRVLHRRCAGEELREAVSLLDFASGAKTQPCPQSVCAVQDLAVCYAIRDGPGYVPERLAVARETLERIDPSWACFDCINAEYFSALMDNDEVSEALAFIEGQLALAAEHGSFEVGFNATLNRARALARLGRPAQALELVDSIHDPERHGRSRQMTHRQLRVWVLVKLGRLDEALALHPQLSAIADTGSHLRAWVDNLAALIDGEMVPNTARIGRELLTVQQRFEHSSAHWDAARTALISARLAAARGARVLTRMLLDDLDDLASRLRRPELLDERREQVERALAALAATDSPARTALADPTTDPEQALDHLAPLHELDALVQAGQAGQAKLGRTLDLAAALRGVGRADRARALLETGAAAATGELAERLLIELAQTLLAAHDHGALELLLGGDVHGHTRAPETWLRLRWLLGQSLRERGQLERAIRHDQGTLARAPAATPVRLRLAAMARSHGDWAMALDALELAAEELPPGNVDWDRITAATVLGQWAKVRAAAARLEISVPGRGDEPIDADFGLIRCEFVEPSGSRERYWARRTSPCAARIIEIAMPSDPQHFHDRVVFEPHDLYAHLREQNAGHRPCFEVVAVTEPGGHRSFLLRGFDPGEEQVEALEARIREIGCGFERITRVGRCASDPRADPQQDDANEVPTLALLIACADPADPRELRRAVLEVSEGWELPLLDPTLDEAAGEIDAAKRATSLLEHWKP